MQFQLCVDARAKASGAHRFGHVARVYDEGPYEVCVIGRDGSHGGLQERLRYQPDQLALAFAMGTHQRLGAGLGDDGEGCSYKHFPAELVSKVFMTADLDAPVTSLYFENEGEGMGKGIAADLAAELKVNGMLTHLSLAYNDLESAGETALADALGVNTALVKMELAGTYLSRCGIGMLAQALKINTTLTQLNLKCTDIDDEGAEMLAQALEINRTLTELDLRDNDMLSCAGWERIEDALDVQKTCTLV